VDVEGDLSHAEVEEDREAGGAGGRETEAGLPRDQHLPLRILPLRRRCRCHSREGGKTRFLRKTRGLAQRIYVLLGCPCLISVKPSHERICWPVGSIRPKSTNSMSKKYHCSKVILGHSI
jgi:hypothetical protein